MLLFVFCLLSLAAHTRANAVPSVELQPIPATIVDGVPFDLVTCFQNDGDMTGFVPLIDLYLPAGFAPVGPPTATGNLPIVRRTTLLSSNTECEDHPRLTDDKLPLAEQSNDPNAADLCPGEAGGRYLTTRLPFSGFGAATSQVCVTHAVVFTEADAAPGDDEHTFATRGIFLLGQQPNRDFDNDPAIVADGTVADPDAWSVQRTQQSGDIAISFEFGDFTDKSFTQNGTVITGGVCSFFPEQYNFTGNVEICIPEPFQLAGQLADYVRLESHPDADPATSYFLMTPPDPVQDAEGCFDVHVETDGPFCVKFDVDNPFPIDGNGTGTGSPIEFPEFDFTVRINGTLNDGVTVIDVDESSGQGVLNVPYFFEKEDVSVVDNGDGVFGRDDTVIFALSGELGVPLDVFNVNVSDTLPDGLVYTGPVTLSLTDDNGISLAAVDIAAYTTATGPSLATGETELSFALMDAVRAELSNGTLNIAAPFQFTLEYTTHLSGYINGTEYTPQDCLVNAADLLFDFNLGNGTESVSVPTSHSYNAEEGALDLSLYAIDGVVCAPQPCDETLAGSPGQRLTYRFRYNVTTNSFDSAEFQVMFPVPEFDVTSVVKLDGSPALFGAHTTEQGPDVDWPNVFDSWTHTVDNTSGLIQLGAGTFAHMGDGTANEYVSDFFVTVEKTTRPSLDNSTVVVFGDVGYSNRKRQCVAHPQDWALFGNAQPFVCLQSGFVSIDAGAYTLKTSGVRLDRCIDGDDDDDDGFPPALSGLGEHPPHTAPFTASDFDFDTLGCEARDMTIDDCTQYAAALANRGSFPAYGIRARLAGFIESYLYAGTPRAYLGSDPTTDIYNTAGYAVSNNMATGEHHVMIDELPQGEVYVFVVEYCSNTTLEAAEVESVTSHLDEYYSAPGVVGQEEYNFVEVLDDNGDLGSCEVRDTTRIDSQEGEVCGAELDLRKKCPNLPDDGFIRLGDYFYLTVNITVPHVVYEDLVVRIQLRNVNSGHTPQFAVSEVEHVENTLLQAEYDPPNYLGPTVLTTGTGGRIGMELGTVQADDVNNTYVFRMRLDYVGDDDISDDIQLRIGMLADAHSGNFHTRSDPVSGARLDLNVKLRTLAPTGITVLGSAGVLDFDTLNNEKCCDMELESTYLCPENALELTANYHIAGGGQPVPPQLTLHNLNTSEETGSGPLRIDYYTLDDMSAAPFHFSVCYAWHDVDAARLALLDGSASFEQNDLPFTFEPDATVQIDLNCTDVTVATTDDACGFGLELPYLHGLVGSENDVPNGDLQHATEPYEYIYDNVTIKLLDISDMVWQTTTTGADGEYFFTVLPGQPYQLQIMPMDAPHSALSGEQMLELTVFEAPGVPEERNNNARVDLSNNNYYIDVASLASDGSSLWNNFVFIEDPFKIGDYIWEDANRDGHQGAPGDEPPFENIVVQLLNANGTVIDTTITSGGGIYYFYSDATEGLVRSTAGYTIRVDPAQFPEHELTLSNAAGSDGTDNDAVLQGGQFEIAFTSPTVGDDLTLDVGVQELPIEVGNYVWRDDDNDGTQNGESGTGIAGVNVVLLAPDGSFIGVTVTNTAGFYEFRSDMFPALRADVANYTLHIDLSDGANPPLALLAPIPANQGGNDGYDSDAVLGIDELYKITFTAPPAGGQDHTLDFGFTPGFTIGDLVWIDGDGDGQQGGTDDIGVPGVTVHLLAADGTPLATTATDANGLYSFRSADIDGLDFATDDYKLYIDIDAEPSLHNYMLTLDNVGLEQLPDNAVDSDAVHNNATGWEEIVFDSAAVPSDDLTFDFGLVPKAASRLGDRVFLDDNGDGLQSPGELGVANATLILYGPDSEELATTQTNAAGVYFFATDEIEGFNPGQSDHSIRLVSESVPAGLELTEPNVGGNDALDSDGLALSQTEWYIVGVQAPDAGANDLTHDFGLVNAVQGDIRIGDRVWLDFNADGIQDEGELPIDGATVNLLRASDGLVLATTLTDATGNYYFDSADVVGFAPNGGDYIVSVQNTARIANFGQSPAHIGLDDAVDSDGVYFAGRDAYETQFTAGVPGWQDLTFDFGFFPSHCDDGNKCTMSFIDDRGDCVHMEIVCEQDDNPCTRKECDEGQCRTVVLTGSNCTIANISWYDDDDYGMEFEGTCNEEGDCIVFQPCQQDADCTGMGQGCSYKCHNFVCRPMDNDDNCDNGNPCDEDVCDAGQCRHTNLDVGTPCMTVPPDNWYLYYSDDGSDLPPTDATCMGLCIAGGTCKCTPPSCDDENSCTTDHYNSDIGDCVHVPISCDDQSDCTTDWCETELGCQHEDVVCTDNNACTVDQCAREGGCFYSPIVCPAQDRCHTAQCVERPVGQNNTVLQGVCEQAPIDCDDGDICTLDECLPNLGCRSTSIDGCRACTDAADCDDNDVCSSEACVDGVCFYQSIGGALGFTNSSNLCVETVCHPSRGLIDVPRECPQWQPFIVYGGVTYNQAPGYGDERDLFRAPACEIKKCNPNTGNCWTEDLDCTPPSMCQKGYCDPSCNKCVYEPVQCVPKDECHTAHCDMTLGCVDVPKLLVPPNACQTVTCEPGTGLVYEDRNCDTGDACLIGGCSPASGCTSTPIDCETDNICQVNERCENGECTWDERDCPEPENPCQEAFCDPEDGCGVRDKFCPNPPSPRFLSKCNEANGECIFVFKSCLDDDVCTRDRVRLNGDCVHEPIDGCCRDNSECPLSTKCISWSCDPTEHVCVQSSTQNCCTEDADCSDGLFCTTDHCQVATGTCFNHPIECPGDPNDLCRHTYCSEESGGMCNTLPKTCDDDNACSDDRCNPIDGSCINELVVKCDNGNLCDLSQCDPDTGECVHTPCVFDDQNPCTLNDCDPLSGKPLFTPIDVDDKNMCTLDICTKKGRIKHIPIDCDDSCPCTIDTCLPKKGCINTPVNYSNMTGGNVCLTARCDPLTGDPIIEHVPNCCRSNSDCHERGAQCVTGRCDYNTHQCVFTPKEDCCEIDGDCFTSNKCLISSCEASTGKCCHDPIECVAPDSCHTAQCFPDRGCVIEPKDCASADPCLVDGCENGVCFHKPMQCSQPDDPCALQNHCVRGECVPEDLFPCDDQLSCTDDVCRKRVTKPICEPEECEQNQEWGAWLEQRGCEERGECNEKIHCIHTPCECKIPDPCSESHCSEEVGGCVHERKPFSECCMADADCETYSICERSYCDFNEHKCVTEPIEDCCFRDEDCVDESNLCLSEARCCKETNQCQYKEKSCASNNLCLEGTCLPTTGECEFRSNATRCDSHDLCKNDFCDPDVGCVSRDVECAQSVDACHTAVCSRVSGCITIAKDCDTDRFCSIGSCSLELDGACVSEPRDCDNGNVCQEHYCDEANDRCLHVPAKHPDEDTPEGACKVFTCDPVTGWSVRDKICHAHDSCHVARCVDGVGCVEQERSCDDGNRCSRDRCEPGLFGGCRHEQIKHCCATNADCDDGDDECTVDSCVLSQCHHKRVLSPECCDQWGRWLPKERRAQALQDKALQLERKMPQQRKLLGIAIAEPECGDGLLDEGEQCDGAGDDTFFHRCTDECELRLHVGAVVAVMIASVCGACMCCWAFMAVQRRRYRRKDRR